MWLLALLAHTPKSQRYNDIGWCLSQWAGLARGENREARQANLNLTLSPPLRYRKVLPVRQDALTLNVIPKLTGERSNAVSGLTVPPDARAHTHKP